MTVPLPIRTSEKRKEDPMPNEADSGIHHFEYADQESAIVALLRSSGKLTVEEIVARIPDLSWSQLFLAVGLLSRTKDVILRREGFTYTLEMAKPSPVLAGASHGRRLLIIDNEPHICESLRDRLEAMGYTVIVAHDGRTRLTLMALEAKQTPIRSVLLDLQMPVMDGIQVLRKLKV